MPGGAASGQVVSPTAAATPYTQMLRQLHAQADKLLAAEAATAEVIKGLDCIALAMAAAAQERAALCAQHKLKQLEHQRGRQERQHACRGLHMLLRGRRARPAPASRRRAICASG